MAQFQLTANHGRCFLIPGMIKHQGSRSAYFKAFTGSPHVFTVTGTESEAGLDPEFLADYRHEAGLTAESAKDVEPRSPPSAKTGWARAARPRILIRRVAFTFLVKC